MENAKYQVLWIIKCQTRNYKDCTKTSKAIFEKVSSCKTKILQNVKRTNLSFKKAKFQGRIQRSMEVNFLEIFRLNSENENKTNEIDFLRK